MWDIKEWYEDEKVVKIECQYLTDILDAVKAAATKPDVFFITAERQGKKTAELMKGKMTNVVYQ